MIPNTVHVQPSLDPDVVGGAACFVGTRVLAKNLFDYLEGSSHSKNFYKIFRP
jgi:uncharacterized protein (DUF433 family)